MTRVVFLGPQRFDPILGSVVRSLGVTGTIATITAGWQEREEEDGELHEHLEKRTVNLRLYGRAETVFEEDPDLASAHRERQERLGEIQTLYRVRLEYAMEAASELMRREADPGVIEPEREAAIDAIRALDAGHKTRIRAVHAAWLARWRPAERGAVRRQRKEIAGALRDAAAVCIAGGHVAVLLNRLRLFDLAGLFGERPIIAWSAGAMTLADRVVLFHDDPPEGPGRAELLDVGLGLIPGVVPLPHARRRLRTDDADRMSRLARRFAPATCVALDAGARIDWDGKAWTGGVKTLLVRTDGRLAPVPATTASSARAA